MPGEGLDVPIWLLGSSDFSARLAAELGLPFAFASHFAPDYLLPALRLYRENFKPSERLAEPYVMVGVNVVAADTDAEARRLFTSLQQQFLNLVRGRPGQLPPPVDDHGRPLGRRGAGARRADDAGLGRGVRRQGAGAAGSHPGRDRRGRADADGTHLRPRRTAAIVRAGVAGDAGGRYGSEARGGSDETVMRTDRSSNWPCFFFFVVCLARFWSCWHPLARHVGHCKHPARGVGRPGDR